MRTLSLAIVAAGLCIASASADAAPADSITTSADQAFWSLTAGAALVLFVLSLVRGDRR